MPQFDPPCSKRIAVVGSIAQQGLTLTQSTHHVRGRTPAMRLAFHNLERRGTPVGIVQCMDPARQKAREQPMPPGRPTFLKKMRRAVARVRG